MTRKSKQRGHHNPFTYQEAASTLTHYGTQKARLGTDSQLPFGHCALSLTAIVDGVVSPSGTLYERSAAVEYLLKETEKLTDWKAAYQRQCESDANQLESEELLKDKERLTSLESKSGGLTTSSSSSHVSKHGAKRLDKLKEEGFDVATDEDNKKHLKRTSYWLSDWAPDVGAKRIEEPPKRPSSPFSGKALRLKDLKSVELCLGNGLGAKIASRSAPGRSPSLGVLDIWKHFGLKWEPFGPV